MSLSSKEKKEIGIIIASVLVVALVGLGLSSLDQDQPVNTAGAAVKLDPNLPSYPGILVMLRDYCSVTEGKGDCNKICEQKTCIPVEHNCNEVIEQNSCWCCNPPE